MEAMTEMLNNDIVDFQMTAVKLGVVKDLCPEQALAVRLESMFWPSLGLFLLYHVISSLFKFNILPKMAICIYTLDCSLLKERLKVEMS